MKSKKILITGASGFIGRHLMSKFIASGHEVIGLVHHWDTTIPAKNGCQIIQGSCNDQDFLKKTIDEIEPEIVIHLASKTSPGRDLYDLVPQMRNTFEPAINVANALSSSVKLAIFFGSCEEYGNGPTPFMEDQTPVCFSPYGWGKISAYYAVSLIAKLRDLPVCWARPFLTYGPGQPGNLLIPTVIRGCLEDRKIPLTLGEQTRDFLYVSDLCKMISRMIEFPERAVGQTINLCVGKPRTIRSVAEEIHTNIGKGEISFGAVPYRRYEAMSFFGSPEKFHRLYGEVPLTPFSEAIAMTINSYRLSHPEKTELKD